MQHKIRIKVEYKEGYSFMHWSKKKKVDGQKKFNKIFVHINLTWYSIYDKSSCRH